MSGIFKGFTIQHCIKILLICIKNYFKITCFIKWLYLIDIFLLKYIFNLCIYVFIYVYINVNFTVLAEIYPVIRTFTVLAKRELFYLWPFGLAAWLCGTIFIDRLNPGEAKSSVNRTGDIIRTRQVSKYTFSYLCINYF